jgi:hypothetical protein
MLHPGEQRASVKRSFHFSFFIFRQSLGLLGRGINLSQGLYLHTGQPKHRINVHTKHPCLSGIRTHDHSVRASEDSSCLRPLGYRDRPLICYSRSQNLNCATFSKHLLVIFMSWFCPAFWWRDSNMYLVFSVITSRPASLLASIKESVFFFVISMLYPSRFASSA